MVLWQWIALLGQIAAIFSIGRMVDCILMHQMSDQVILTTFMVLVVAVAIRFYVIRWQQGRHLQQVLM